MEEKELSYNDIKRGLKIPTILSKELAEETGIHIGDGNLGVHPNGKSLKYQYSISGWTGDEDYLKEYVVPLMHKIYGIYPSVYRSKTSKSIELHYQSKGLVHFKKSLNLPLGRKDDLVIPNIILHSKFKQDFIRGLFDTDGSICFKKRYKDINYYPSISMGSKSTSLILQVSKILSAIGFRFSVTLEIVSYRNNSKCKISRIDIYGKKNLLKWMEIIGTSKKRNIEKFKFWKEHGYVHNEMIKAPAGI